MPLELVKFLRCLSSGPILGSMGVLQQECVTSNEVAGSRRVPMAHNTSLVFEGSTSSSTKTITRGFF